MAEVVRMRRMSDTMEEGVIVEWLVKVGDEIKIGDVLAEVETDKATMDFDSLANGTLLHIEAEVGTTVPVDGILAVLGKKGEDFKVALSEAKASTPTSSSVPVQEATLAPVAEPDSTPEPATTATPTAQPVAAPIEQVQVSTDGRVKASPLAKKLANESGINIAQVPGSGEGGRVVRRDVENYSPSKLPAAAFAPNISSESFVETPVSQMRKAITRRLSESKFSAPHFYLTREINMDRVVEARSAINDYLGSKVSFNDIIIKAAAAALKLHPGVNSAWMGDRIRTNHHVHIGVATAIDDGLIVPVIKHADAKPISAISAEVKELGAKARDKKLQPEEYSGNTFTISNLGMFGIDEFTAIINTPDVCILAVGAIVQKPVVKNGEIAIGNMMKVTLSCDHRVVDGAMGAKFLQTFAQFLEEPIRIIA
ncbi:MAG: pyruvate dehydrogenase complex dihydrolipoamide acetyltransferase [Bacteroidetes bacterium]|nr:pyruvate dehydrogenase complex dihydrolipoamide acetyltransferase [Bacteroidota bacterium]